MHETVPIGMPSSEGFLLGCHVRKGLVTYTSSTVCSTEYTAITVSLDNNQNALHGSMKTSDTTYTGRTPMQPLCGVSCVEFSSTLRLLVSISYPRRISPLNLKSISHIEIHLYLLTSQLDARSSRVMFPSSNPGTGSYASCATIYRSSNSATRN